MCYAPGGRAAYPSTVLMTAVLAAVAGVDHVYVASPPSRDGRPSDLVLAAAHLAGVEAVFAVGGAQAVGAFAYGTKSIPAVDKIVGPGNVYVAEAKRQVVGTVGIDSLAGPSELALVAEKDTDPSLVAIDLAAQAEHDPDARAILVAPTEAYARLVAEELKKVAAGSDRRAILSQSLDEQGLAVVAKDFATQIRVLDAAAPEHVQLMVKRPGRYTQALRHAGTVFEGVDAPAPLGDYVTGADHVLPTGGTARWDGPLGVADFMKPLVVQRVTRAGIQAVGPHAVTLAEAEGLPAHAESVRRRL
jgi:histidinol dehydrogenase